MRSSGGGTNEEVAAGGGNGLKVRVRVWNSGNFGEEDEQMYFENFLGFSEGNFVDF